MSFDITDFSGMGTGQGSYQHKPSPPQPESKPQAVEAGGEVSRLAREFNSIPSMTKKEKDMEQRRKEELPGAWSIDKAIEDGQIFSGDVDKDQADFLEKTTFVD